MKKFKNLYDSIKLSRPLIFNSLVLLLLFYFIFHSIYGNLGIISYFKFKAQLETTYNELEVLRATRVDIEHKVKLLRPESLDKDMLDERVRNVLSIAGKDEQVFVYKSGTE